MKNIIVIELPIDTVSEANKREHWTRKANRVKCQRSEAYYLCMLNEGIFYDDMKSNIKINLTRLAPRSLDSDNLCCALKAVRDGIADWLRIDDGSKRLKWDYDQKRISKTKSIRVEIAILNP